MKLFEAIVGERMLKNSIAKKEALEAQLEKVVVGQDDPELEKIVQQNVNKALEPKPLVAQIPLPAPMPQPAAAAAGGARKKKHRTRSRKKKRK